MLEAFSVTTSRLPSGENETCAGPGAPAPSGRVEPAIGVSESLSTEKPVMLAAAAGVQDVEHVVVARSG